MLRAAPVGRGNGEAAGAEHLPEELRQLVAGVKGRAPLERVHAVILALCRHRPMSKGELAGVLERSTKYIQQACLEPLVKAGRLRMLHPEAPRHPAQRYVSVDTCS